MSGVVRGSLFLFARQVRFFERHSPQNQTPRAAGWVKTNYGGVKRQAQWGTEETGRFSAPLDTVSAGQQREMVGPNNGVLYLDLKALWALMDHMSSPSFEDACFNFRGKSDFFTVERQVFQKENSRKWSCMYSLINFNWFSFTRQTNDGVEASWLVSFQTQISVWDQSRQISITTSRGSLW